MAIISLGSVLWTRELPHIPKNPTNPMSYISQVFNCVMFSVAAIVVFLRILARYKIRSFGKDDIFMLCTLLLFFISCMAEIAGQKAYDGGSDASTFKAAQLYLYWFLVTQISYSWTMVFLKLSIGYFFLRLLVTPAQRRTVYAVMAFATSLNIILSIYDIFQCGNPRDYPLKVELKEGCPPQTVQKATAWIQAILNALTDLIFAIIPFWLLHNSMLPRSLRIYVLSILCLATTGCLASFVRMAFIKQLFSTHFTTSIEQLGIVTTVEMGMGIIASSLATLRPLLCSGRNSTSKLSGTFSSFGSPPRHQPNSLAASSGLGTQRSMHSLVEAEARYGSRKQAMQPHRQQQQEKNPSEGELVRDEVIFSPDATHTTFLADESDHEANWNHGNPPRHGIARQPAIWEVEMAHVKSGAGVYHTWRS